MTRHGTDMRWCDPWGKWLIWDGRRRAVDQERRAESLAKDVARTLWADVGKLLPDVAGDVAIELVRFAHAAASARGIANMLTLRGAKPIFRFYLIRSTHTLGS